jgi:transcriptional regulator NrdR family protein
VETLNGKNNEIYRRRKCWDCNSLFRSIEVIDKSKKVFKTGYSEAIKRKRGLINAED